MPTYSHKVRINYENSKRLQAICSELHDLVIFFDKQGKRIGGQSEPSKLRVGGGLAYYILANKTELLSAHN